MSIVGRTRDDIEAILPEIGRLMEAGNPKVCRPMPDGPGGFAYEIIDDDDDEEVDELTPDPLPAVGQFEDGGGA